MYEESASKSAENDITLTNNKEALVEVKSLLKIYNVRINKIENKIIKKLKLYFEILSIPIEKKG
jgi:DNA-directed RNA polymerase sigma subunit (sigma70/sigma32)